MVNGSPKERLQKLFHKREAKKDEDPSSPPRASPSSAGVRQHVRKISSRASLRDVLHSRGRSESKAGQGVSSGTSGQVPTPTPGTSAQASQQLSGTSRNAPQQASGASNQTYQQNMPASEPHPAARAAATKAMYPDEDFTDSRAAEEPYTRVVDDRPTKLPLVPHESDLSTDLQHLTMSDAAGQQPFSEDVADRNINRRKAASIEARRAVFEQPNGTTTRAGNAKPLVSGAQPYSEDVANWNIVQNGPLSSQQSAPAPLNVKKRGSVDPRAENFGTPITPTTSADGRSLSRKPVVSELRRSSDAVRSGNPLMPTSDAMRSGEAGRRSNSIRRSSLHKPLPPAPSDEYENDLDGDRVISKDLPDVHSALGKERGYLVRDAEKPVDLTGIVDLRNTEDTTLHETWAPAVTHETIVQNVHEIREEQITREIHNHHVFHRILPIVDIEVLPARHFVPVEGGYAEISEDEVPGRTGVNAQWIIAETMSKLMPESKGPVVPQQFTARKFQGTDGDYKEYMTPEGFKRTEQWWVHPPTIETGGKESGQTYAFHIGSPNPADDGLRAHLPVGQVVGISPLLAKQQRERLRGAQNGTAVEEANGEAPPPVPAHKMFPAEMVDASRSGHTRPQASHGFSYENIY
ncbi:hypothetical protein LTR85_008201 [Meristemomyces frigidus]|nr:hypothetical protein LTR85_008201 [Meristemomyces frigidus]